MSVSGRDPAREQVRVYCSQWASCRWSGLRQPVLVALDGSVSEVWEGGRPVARTDEQAIRVWLMDIVDAVLVEQRMEIAEDIGAALGRLVASLQEARREVEWQMETRLSAEMTLKLTCEAIDLPLARLGNGWKESTAVIVARLTEIVDAENEAQAEVSRLTSERDEAREWAIKVEHAELRKTAIAVANLQRAEAAEGEVARLTERLQEVEHPFDADEMRAANERCQAAEGEVARLRDALTEITGVFSVGAARATARAALAARLSVVLAEKASEPLAGGGDDGKPLPASGATRVAPAASAWSHWPSEHFMHEDASEPSSDEQAGSQFAASTDAEGPRATPGGSLTSFACSRCGHRRGVHKPGKDLCLEACGHPEAHSGPCCTSDSECCATDHVDGCFATAVPQAPPEPPNEVEVQTAPDAWDDGCTCNWIHPRLGMRVPHPGCPVHGEVDSLRARLGETEDALRAEVEMTEQTRETLRDLKARWRDCIEEHTPDGDELMIDNILFWLIEDCDTTRSRAVLDGTQDGQP